MSILRQRAVPAQSYEIDYLRLVQFYQRKHHHDDNVIFNQQQVLISIPEVRKYANENDLVIDILLTQYQQNEYEKLKKKIEITENKPRRKPTKRKTSATMTEVHNITTEQ
jgi:hypothetical protein